MFGSIDKILLRTFWAWAMISISLPGIASADKIYPRGGGIQIEEASATPALKGNCATIRLRIVNSGYQAENLLRIESPAALASRMLGRIGDRHTVDLESVHIPADDALDLTTSHFRFEMCGLNAPLEAGDIFPASLVFSVGALPIEIHVHADDLN